MQNFEDFNIENMGGIESFNFIPNFYISKYPDVINNVISDAIEFVSGKHFFEGKAANKSLLLEEDCTHPDGGTLYKYKLSGIYIGQSSTMHSLFNEMANMFHVVDFTDNNGKRRIIGNDKNGAKFLFNYKSKDTPSGRPEYNFNFMWENTDVAPFYEI